MNLPEGPRHLFRCGGGGRWFSYTACGVWAIIEDVVMHAEHVSCGNCRRTVLFKEMLVGIEGRPTGARGTGDRAGTECPEVGVPSGVVEDRGGG